MADSYLSVVLQLAGTVIMARLLTPREAGVFAVAAVFATLGSTFRDFGIAEYMIQEAQLTQDKIRAALAANIALSWSVGLLLLAISGPVGEFYRHAGVTDVIRVQALGFVIIPFGALSMAWYRRSLNFQPMFVATLLSSLTSFSVAVSLALIGFSYMSLAWSALSGVAVTVAVSFWFRPSGFPRWPGGWAELPKVLHFGKHATGVYLVGQFGRSAPEMVIGRVIGLDAVAFFNRAGGLYEIFQRTVLRAVMPVCLPFLAKRSREGHALAGGYATMVGLLSAVGWPALALLGLGAYSAVRIIYGSQWMLSVPLAQIICMVGAVELVHSLSKEALIAAGRIDRSNLLQALVQGSRVIGLLAVIPFGLKGAAWGLLGAAVVGCVLSQWMLSRVIGLRAADLAAACLPSLLVTLVASAPLALWILVEGIGEYNYVRSALVATSTGLIGWFLAVRWLHPAMQAEVAAVTARLFGRWRREPSGGLS